MDRKLINYLPYVVRDYAEFQGITGAEQPEFETAWAAADDLLANQFIKTAGNLGLSRWEKSWVSLQREQIPWMIGGSVYWPG